MLIKIRSKHCHGHELDELLASLRWLPIVRGLHVRIGQKFK